MIQFYYRGMSALSLCENSPILDPDRNFFGENHNLFTQYLVQLQQSGINQVIRDTYDNPLENILRWSLRDLHSPSIDFTPNYDDAVSYAQNFCGSQLLHNLKLITEQVNGFSDMKNEVVRVLNKEYLRPHRPIVLKVNANCGKFIFTEFDNIVKLIAPLSLSEIKEIIV